MQTNNKLRNALETLVDLVNAWKDHLPPAIRDGGVEKAIEKAEATLAEPLRNCDVGTLEDRREQFKQFCKSHSNGVVCDRNCPLFKLHINGYSCHFEWGELPI